MNPAAKDDSLQILQGLVALHEKDAEPKLRDRPVDFHTLKGLCELHSIAQREMANSLRSEQIGDALRPSIFDLMEHNFRENTHSNVLEYLFDCHRGLWGRRLMRAFLDSVLPLEAPFWDETAEYETIREYDLQIGADRGRIDLLIINPSQRRLIGIESKVLADIGLRDNHGTQLDLYEKALAEKFVDYARSYVLLSFIPQEDVPSHWTYSSFAPLQTAMRMDASHDHIVEEYRRLLITMHTGASIKELTTIKSRLDDAEQELSLAQMHQLKEYLNAIAQS